MVRRRPLGRVAIAALVALLFGTSATTSLARLTDSGTSSEGLSTDTLDPPTTLVATGGASASLTWAVTPDAYASGYELQRAIISGRLSIMPL